MPHDTARILLFFIFIATVSYSKGLLKKFSRHSVKHVQLSETFQEQSFNFMLVNKPRECEQCFFALQQPFVESLMRT